MNYYPVQKEYHDDPKIDNDSINDLKARKNTIAQYNVIGDQKIPKLKSLRFFQKIGMFWPPHTLSLFLMSFPS